ncbi:MAG: S-adenosylmethionine:tRNA ribosyltransferase-isomerase, partial [Campylobacterales bacterium]
MLEYHLPSELIANSPANPRDSSRLLVYSRATKSISHDRFYNLQNHLPENLSIIFNSTKVIKARLYGLKETGGKLELLYEKQGDRGYIFQIGGRVKEGTRIV